MERFFISLKLEWVATLGYSSLLEAKHTIVNYIIGYYSQVKPHQHNAGLAPNLAEQKYWIELNSVAKKNLTTKYT